MSQRNFNDHFSGHARDYARARPGYPAPLFEWLAANARGRRLAWDVGTGNGQAARGLAPFFDRVHATDASPEQIAEARGPDAIGFACEPAEHCSLADASADLVTAGQAMHWFELSAFYREVKRVLRPGGMLAVWTYQLNRIDPEVDRHVRWFFDDVIGTYWPPERVHVEAGYQDLPFPFAERSVPAFGLATEWGLDRFLAYVDTWSAVRRYRADRGEDPLPALREALIGPWGGEARQRRIGWPLAVRVGTRP